MGETSLTPDGRSPGTPIPHSFFARSPLEVAPELLGAVLVSVKGSERTSGRVVETEAYLGHDDPGSHASTIGITPRNSVMYGPPGATYVYFTYGNHHMTNIVCAEEGVAGAVLLRALEPLEGLGEMARRRGDRERSQLCNGPGKLSQALGIDLDDNGVLLGEGALQLVFGEPAEPGEILTTGRIGLRKGHELPYRFFLAGDAHVSRAKPGPLRPKA